MTLTKKQQKIRAKGVGSSEIAMLVMKEDGSPLSPYGGPHTLWRRKLGMDGPKSVTGSMHVGNVYEKATAQDWAKTNGYKLKKAPTVQMPDRPVVVDSVDFLAFESGDDGAAGCVEVKVANMMKNHLWGKPGTDEVPLEFAVQGQWHCGAHKSPWCAFPRFDGFQRTDYYLDADTAIFEGLVAIAEKFWQDFVLTGNEPTADAFDDTSKWLARRFAGNVQEKMLQADAAMIDKLLELRELAIFAADYEKRLKALENEIKQAIGDSEGIIIPDTKQKVTFKSRVGKSRLDVAGLLNDVCEGNEKAIEELKAKHTQAGAPYRVFLKTALLKN